jgi:hypothetical protein
VDALVNAALAKVNETVGAVPWDKIERIRPGELLLTATTDEITHRIGAAIHAVDALKSALKAAW